MEPTIDSLNNINLSQESKNEIDEIDEIDGIKFEWVRNFYDDSANFILFSKNKTPTQYKNPWNYIMEKGGKDLYDKIYATRPKTRRQKGDYEGAPIVIVKYLNKHQLTEYLKSSIVSDCWSVYSTNDTRDLYKNYFNSFATGIDYGKTKDNIEDVTRNKLMEDVTRDKLIDDPTPLLEDLENDLRLHIVMNIAHIRYIIKKVPNDEMMKIWKYSITSIYCKSKD